MYEIVLNKKGAISKVFKVTLFDGTYLLQHGQLPVAPFTNMV